MPRFFDDYSNTYLTHDSSAGRKQQRRGWKFRENFRLHYEAFIPEWRKGPMGLASAQQAFLKARGANDPAVPPLPDGWKEEVDDVTGITYYVNMENKQRTWVRPGFIPPAPGGGPPRPRGPPGPYPPQHQQPPPQHYHGGPPPPPGQGLPPTLQHYQAGPPPPPSHMSQPPPHPNMAQYPPPPPPPGGLPPPPGAPGYR